MAENGKRNMYLWVVNGMALLLFVSIWRGVTAGSWFAGADRWVSLHASSVRREWLDPLVQMLTDMNGLWGAALFAIVVSGILAWRHRYAEAGFYLAVWLGSMALFGGIKSLVARARPESAVIAEGGYAFPSGHTTMAAAMAFALYFIIRERQRGRACLFWWIALGWAVLIALTRLYLGVHWLSDVTAGFALGVWWVTLLKIVWRA